MPKAVIIAGFLGSGKTTTLIQLGRALRLRYGKKVAIVVNEIGEVDVDGKFIRDFGLEAKEILGGCICCSIKQDLVTTIKTILSSYDPDVILIEPTGVALPRQIARIISDIAIERKDISLAPIVTLVDGARFREILKELRDFLVKQIKDANVIGINKLDLIDRKFELELLKSALKELNPDATILSFSARTGEGLSDLLSTLLFGEPEGGKEGVISEELDSLQTSEIGGCGVEASVESKDALDDLSLKMLISELINGIAGKALKAGGNLIGHVKAHVECPAGSFKASLVDVTAGVDFSGNIKDKVKNFKLTLFATVRGLTHDEIKHVVEDGLRECAEKRSLTMGFVEAHH